MIRSGRPLRLTTMIGSGRPLRFEVPEQGWKYYDEKYLEKEFSNCTATESGSSLKRPCVFPFKYYDKNTNKQEIFHTCAPNSEIQPWCATEVYENEYTIKWGVCGPDCPFQKDLENAWINDG